MSCMSCMSCITCVCVCVSILNSKLPAPPWNSKSQTKTPTAPVVEEAWQGQQLRWSSKANNFEATQDPWRTRGQPHEVGCVREAWKPGQRRSFQGTKAMGSKVRWGERCLSCIRWHSESLSLYHRNDQIQLQWLCSCYCNWLLASHTTGARVNWSLERIHYSIVYAGELRAQLQRKEPPVRPCCWV